MQQGEKTLYYNLLYRYSAVGQALRDNPLESSGLFTLQIKAEIVRKRNVDAELDLLRVNSVCNHQTVDLLLYDAFQYSIPFEISV